MLLGFTYSKGNRIFDDLGRRVEICRPYPNTLQRLATKAASEPLVDTLGEAFRQNQLDLGTRGGWEAVAHAAWQPFGSQTECRFFLEIYVENSFNGLRRHAFLAEARTKLPSLFKLLLEAYSPSSKLFFFEDYELDSIEGIQIGDHFDLALFSIAVDLITKKRQF